MRYLDLTPQQQADITQYIQDGCNEDVHEARAKMDEDWDVDKKERYMKRAAKKDWEVLSTFIGEHLQEKFGIAVDDRLLRDLCIEHRDYWEDAAGWSDYD